MIEKIFIAIILACNLILATELAKYGIRQVGLRNKLYKVVFVGAITLFIGGILQSYGYARIENILVSSIIIFGLPSIWFILERYLFMVKGEYFRNVATVITKNLTLMYYFPGEIKRNDAQKIQNDKMALKALKLFKKVLEIEKNGASVNSYNKNEDEMYQSILINKLNIINDYISMALLLRIMRMFNEVHKILNLAMFEIDNLLESDPNNKYYLRKKSLILFRKAESYLVEGTHREKALAFAKESILIDESINEINEDEIKDVLELKKLTLSKFV